MQVRGSVVKNIDQFVSERHKGKYNDWKGKLSSKSSQLISTVSDSDWYPIEEAVIDPTQLMCDICYSDSKKGAWESGRYSAEKALTGIYKIFVLVSTPSFLIKRASRVMATFYNPSELVVTDSTSTSMIIQFTKMPVSNSLIEFRIAGWMEKALEICGCNNINVNISKSFTKGDTVFETRINWD